MIKLVWRCTCRPRWSELRDTHGGCGRASFVMQLEDEVEWTQRCTWRPRSSKFGDAIGAQGRVNSEMHLRPWSSEFGDAIGDQDWMNSEMHYDAVTERIWRCTCRLWLSEIRGELGGGRFGGRRDGSWDSIHWLTCICGNVVSWVQHLLTDEKLAGSGRLLILGWCCTWCMLHSVLTPDYGMER